MNEVSHLAKRIKSGDRQALSKAITLAESSNKKDTLSYLSYSPT